MITYSYSWDVVIALTMQTTFNSLQYFDGHITHSSRSFVNFHVIRMKHVELQSNCVHFAHTVEHRQYWTAAGKAMGIMKFPNSTSDPILATEIDFNIKMGGKLLCVLNMLYIWCDVVYIQKNVRTFALWTYRFSFYICRLYAVQGGVNSNSPVQYWNSICSSMSNKGPHENWS